MRLSDTLTKTKVDLPRQGPIRMYFCGPTVYQRAHIGNARPFILGMWLRSWLRSQGRDVTLVHNITDINDRIYEAAPGASAELAARATEWYLEDTDALGLGRPDELPKASEFVEQIIRFIGELIDGGYAYEVEGDVYFRVARDPDYGRLSGQRPDQVEEQEPNPRKEDPRDFALWKANKPDEDTSWDSPWGRGRPGWHIECSVMAEELLGPVFEIHGGGLDLVFPHHENELAQSNALGHDFARIWTHNGLLRFTGSKMSKSEGNIVTIREAIERWGREAILVYYLTGHWSKPIDFSDETMAAAQARVDAFPRGLSRADRSPATTGKSSRTRSRTTSTRRTRSPSCTAGATTTRYGALWTSSVSDRSLTRRRPRRRSSSSPSDAGRRVPRVTSTRPIACAPRSRRRAGRRATSPTDSSSFRSDARAGLRPSCRS